MRAPEDHRVDRLDVEAQQCVELTNTNCSIDLITLFFIVAMALNNLRVVSMMVRNEIVHRH